MRYFLLFTFDEAWRYSCAYDITLVDNELEIYKEHMESVKIKQVILYCCFFLCFFFNLYSGGWNQGPLDTAAA
jgi:hypothetical protein